MVAAKDLYLPDLLLNFPTRTFTESTAGSLFDLEMHDAAVAISSVSDVGGNASFNFTPGPTLVVGDEVRITGFVVETNYNGSFVITATSAGDFETGEAFTGTEAVGDFEELLSRVRKPTIDEAYRTIRNNEVGRGFEEPIIGEGRWVTKDSTSLTTTDATTTLIDSITLEDNTAVLIRIQVIAMESDGSDRNVYIKAQGAYRDGGNATLQGSFTDIHLAVSDSNWLLAYAVSGNDVQVNVTGSVAQTINWICVMQYMEIQ